MEIKISQNFPADLPIIVEDDIFLYPFMIAPIFINDDKNLATLEHAIENKTMVMIVSSKSEFKGYRSFEGIYDAGVVGTIIRRVGLPDGRIKILFQGAAKGKITARLSTNPLIATVDIIHEKRPSDQQIDALLSVLKEKTKTLSTLTHFFPSDLLKTIEEGSDPVRICDLICSTLRLKKQIAYTFFVERDLDKRIFALIDYINDEIETHRLEKEIKSKVHSKIDKNNKEYFLKEQLDRKSTRLNSSHDDISRMPSSA